MGLKPRVAFDVRLVPFREEVRAAFCELLRDPVAMRHVGGAQTAAGADSLFGRALRVTSGGRDARVAHPFVIELRDGRQTVPFAGHGVLFFPDDELLALAGSPEQPTFEVGYYLLPQYWGRGIASQVARMLIAAAGQLGCRSVVATVDDDHPASRRVCEKSGMAEVNRGRDGDGAFIVYSATLEPTAPPSPLRM